VLLHETGYSWARSPDALFPEFKTDPGATIAALALLIYLLDLLHELLLFELPQAYRVMKPVLIAAGALTLSTLHIFSGGETGQRCSFMNPYTARLPWRRC